jgi:hypothetical protein
MTVCTNSSVTNGSPSKYVNAGRNVKMWIDDIVIDQGLSVDQVSGVAMYCQRFGGTSHSVVSFNTLQVWSGACGLVENLNIPDTTNYESVM